MTVFSIQSIPFTHQLSYPIRINDTHLTKRSGLYLVIKDEYDQPLGVGEASPLPGLSTESLTEIKNALHKVTKDHHTVTLNTLSNEISSTFAPFPSLQFGLESAITMLQHPASHTVNLHAFIPCLETCPTHALSPFKTVKCKVGICDLRTELTAIYRLIDTYPDIRFRFDANRRFSLTEALSFFNDIPLDSIDYIEDPCKNPDDDHALYTMLGTPLALDFPTTAHSPYVGLSTLIIKPTLYGSKTAIKKIAHKFSEQTIVFSSSYESLIGLSAIARMAYELSPNIAHGLNTRNVFIPNHPETQTYSTLSIAAAMKLIK